jgi:hypothetical protein
MQFSKESQKIFAPLPRVRYQSSIDADEQPDGTGDSAHRD